MIMKVFFNLNNLILWFYSTILCAADCWVFRRFTKEELHYHFLLLLFFLNHVQWLEEPNCACTLLYCSYKTKKKMLVGDIIVFYHWGALEILLRASIIKGSKSCSLLYENSSWWLAWSLCDFSCSNYPSVMKEESRKHSYPIVQ